MIATTCHALRKRLLSARRTAHTRTRHEVLIVEHRRVHGESVRNLHRKRLSELGPINALEHQSSQFRGHFPHFNTPIGIGLSVDRSLEVISVEAVVADGSRAIRRLSHWRRTLSIPSAMGYSPLRELG